MRSFRKFTSYFVSLLPPFSSSGVRKEGANSLDMKVTFNPFVSLASNNVLNTSSRCLITFLLKSGNAFRTSKHAEASFLLAQLIH